MRMLTWIVLACTISLTLACANEVSAPLRPIEDPSEGPGGDNDDAGSDEDGGEGPGEQPAKAPPTHMVWKRYRAVENDLMNALSLTRNQLCTELGSLSCIDQVHLSGLGGHDPWGQGEYRSLEGPSATTPASVDRVVISACVARVDLDATGSPQIFDSYSLGGNATGEASEREAIDAQNRVLYRRLLARDATDSELGILRELATPGTPLRDVAVASCYAIGTSVEFLFL